MGFCPTFYIPLFSIWISKLSCWGWLWTLNYWSRPYFRAECLHPVFDQGWYFLTNYKLLIEESYLSKMAREPKESYSNNFWQFSFPLPIVKPILCLNEKFGFKRIIIMWKNVNEIFISFLEKIRYNKNIAKCLAYVKDIFSNCYVFAIFTDDLLYWLPCRVLPSASQIQSLNFQFLNSPFVCVYATGMDLEPAWYCDSWSSLELRYILKWLPRFFRNG